MTPERVLFIVNPYAGKAQARRIDWESICSSLEAPAQVVVCPSPQEALSQAQRFCQNGGNILVVAGGDGSVQAVLPALVESSTALALLPLGTSNVLARELGYPLGRRAVQGCLHRLRQGSIQQIDVGVVNGRLFTLMASTGFDAHVLPLVDQKMKRRWGVFAFIWTGLRQLQRYQPTHYQVTLDGQRQQLHAVLLVVSNTARYGWFTVLAPYARPDDGELDIVWLPASLGWRQKVWRVAWDVLRGRAALCPYLRFARAKSVQVEAYSVQQVQCDGELVGTTPMQVHLLPRALRVIVASPPTPSRNAV